MTDFILSVILTATEFGIVLDGTLTGHAALLAISGVTEFLRMILTVMIRRMAQLLLGVQGCLQSALRQIVRLPPQNVRCQEVTLAHCAAFSMRSTRKTVSR